MKKFLLSLLIVFGSSYASHLLAAPFTGAQIKQFKKLSPGQQNAIAEKYGLSPSAVEKNKGKVIATPPVVKPREVTETSATETEFKGKRVEQKIREKETEREKVRHVFDSFVRESKPMAVSTNIKQFGYDLFAGIPTTFAPATDIPVPRNYVVGPGDEVLIDLYGARQDRLSLVVTRKGTLNFPDEGPLQVSGLTFSRMSSLIEKIVNNKMIGVSAYITMGELRSIRVFVLGDVERPGSYMVSGLSTLSHALFVSGGIKKIGSLRNIELKRKGKRVASIDLYDFLLNGDTSGDVRLLPDDVVFVPPIGVTAGIAGEVTRPAIYELDGKTTVKKLINMSGGLRATSFKGMAQIERINENGERIVIDLDLKKRHSKFNLRDGDLVKVYPVLDAEENVVMLLGNVKRPGKREYIKGMKISDLIGSNEDLLPESYYHYGLIEREAEKNREAEFIRFKLEDVLNEIEEADQELKVKDKVYVFNRRYFRQRPMVSIGGVLQLPDSEREKGRDKEMVEESKNSDEFEFYGPFSNVPGVEAVVQSPGTYELKRGMRIVDLILAAGGLLRTAYMDEAELYRTDPATKDVTKISVNLQKVVGDDDRHNLLLQDLDRFVVHSIWEHKRRPEITISGEINMPGTYPLTEGATISDLVFSGGSFTAKAYEKNAELTRYIIVDGERRESQHFEIDLDSILAGDKDSDFKLQPYDHLHIRRLTNWREAETVAINGEIRFPGTYPIEEGETLSDLIERVGGFTANAFLYGARFNRASIANFQKKQFQEMADKLETDVARLSAGPAAAGAEKDVEKQKFAAAALMNMVEKLRATEPDGRLVVKLMGLEQLRKSKFNIILRNGDSLYIPKKPDSVLVIGEIYNPNAFLYEEGENSYDYLTAAGGMTEMANEKAIYVIKADGSVIPVKTGFFRRSVEVGPGDVIVIPEEVRHVSGFELTKDITQIIYQLGLAAASFKAVGVF